MNTSSNKPLISVIIPTFNRANLLEQSLESLAGQSLPKDQFEVVVIDDGSSDNTGDLCKRFETRIDIRYIRQVNSGISAAKNMGVFVSRGPLLMFFDDDDVADAELLSEHVRTHTLYPQEHIAVLGYTTWHPSLTVSRLMEFVTNIGHFLFSYSNLKDGQVLDFTYFWGGRSSCKKSLLVKHGIFNQLFRFGSEDIELGYRLSKFGLKVIYNANAKSYMIRPLTYDQFCQRCIKQGKSQYHFSKMHPDPVIQQYCMVEDSEQKWDFVRQKLESKMHLVGEIEKTLKCARSATEEKALLNELGKLYWWTFNALKIKGIVEEKRADQDPSHEKDTLSVPASISEKDMDLLRTQCAHNLPKTFQRGNILIIDPFLPMFDRASGSLRLFEIMKALIRMGFRLTYIARDGANAGTYVPLLQDMGVEVYPGDPSALQDLGLEIIAPYLDLEKILKSKSFDYVILSFWHIAEYYLPMIRLHSPQSHVIIDTVDIHFLREFREATMKGNRNLLATAEKNKERELAIYQKPDRLWVVTDEDKKAIEGIVSAPIDVVPNIHKKVNWSKEYERTSDLLFVGNFSHKPNIDAVLFLHKKIYPLIRKKMPDVKIFIVGDNPPEQILNLHSDNFIITGYVEDLSSYLKSARISINPLTYGAGMKGKIGEALSWGIPVVTTFIGAEGMHLVDNEDGLIADDPKIFASKIIDVYRNQTLWEKLSRNGKRLVEQRWSPEAIQKRIDSSLLDAWTFDKEQVSVVLAASGDVPAIENSISAIHSSIQGPGESLVISGDLDKKNVPRLLELEHTDFGHRRVRTIIEQHGTDYAGSWNKGLSQSTGGIIVLCRDSHTIDTASLRSAISFAEQQPDVDILVPHTPLLINTEQADEENGYVPASDSQRCFGRITIPRIRPLPFMVIRPSVIKNVGGFDAAIKNDHLAWYDFIMRSAMQGCRLVSMEDLNASGIGVSSPQIGDIEPERKDWNLFVQKWGIPEDAQLPVVCTDIGNRQRFAPFELFSSLGVQDPGDSSAYSPAVSRPLPHEKPHGRPAKLTSIIIPCFNQIAYTKLCLQSIEKYTTVPYELILIDNGSTDGTQAFLEEYSRSRAGCNVILNKRNLGFAGGNNQGITAAKGDYILLLNNDVVVTEGWLERLITHIESDPSIGMIGPMSNSVSGPQLVKDARYGEDLNKMQIFAEEYSRKNLGKRQDILRLVGFCLLIKKEVIDIIGGLDENFISGNFEDDDLCLRSFVAGYRNVMAGDVFVHHYGSMTFKGNGIDYRATMQVNRQYFADKWRGIIEVRGNIYKIKMTKEQQLTKLIERGEEQFSQGHIESAVKIFKRVLLMDRSNFRALNNLGVIQWQIGHAVAAIETFQIALRFNPEDSDALANLLQAVTETGRFDLLNLNLLNTIKQIQPTNPDIDRLVSGHMETHGIPENHYAVENHAESAL